MRKGVLIWVLARITSTKCEVDPVPILCLGMLETAVLHNEVWMGLTS